MKIKITRKITPFLWFDDQAEQAAKFYASIFKNSRIKSVHRYNKTGAKASGRPKGSVMTVSFQLAGQDFTALNGGPVFKFNESLSFVVNCANQEEVDYFWRRLTSGGGKQSQCGWLKDRYGLWWQIVPVEVIRMLSDKNPDRSARVMEVLLSMQKIDLAKLRRAYAGK